MIFFLFAGSLSECQEQMNTVQNVFNELGVPLASDRLVGPLPASTYLGIEIDSTSHSIRLPTDKLTELLQTWLNRKKCTKRELLSLIGSLSFACKVVKPGRIFLRRLIDLASTVSSLNHHIYLNSVSRKDIDWWVQFFPYWNGKEFFQDNPVSSDALLLFTDARYLLQIIFLGNGIQCTAVHRLIMNMERDYSYYVSV